MKSDLWTRTYLSHWRCCCSSLRWNQKMSQPFKIMIFFIHMHFQFLFTDLLNKCALPQWNWKEDSSQPHHHHYHLLIARKNLNRPGLVQHNYMINGEVTGLNKADKCPWMAKLSSQLFICHEELVRVSVPPTASFPCHPSLLLLEILPGGCVHWQCCLGKLTLKVTILIETPCKCWQQQLWQNSLSKWIPQQ